jgi:PadR family transcriptional regulator PadR
MPRSHRETDGPIGNRPQVDDLPHKADVLQGTLVLLVLRTLEALGPLHGYGIARRIEQISGELLQLNQGTLYPALLRMEQEGWISSEWGASEKNRKAKFYSITAAGRKQLAQETTDWQRMSSTINRFLGSTIA